jgi:hypothetical protein
MARVKGPLFSLDARGNVARGALQFRGGLRGTHAYRPTPPDACGEGPSAAQRLHRARYAEAAAAWRALEETTRALWSAAARRHGVTAWNAYLAGWMLGTGPGPGPGGPYVPPPLTHAVRLMGGYTPPLLSAPTPLP